MVADNEGTRRSVGPLFLLSVCSYAGDTKTCTHLRYGTADIWVWRDLLALVCELHILSHEIITANVWPSIPMCSALGFQLNHFLFVFICYSVRATQTYRRKLPWKWYLVCRTCTSYLDWREHLWPWERQHATSFNPLTPNDWYRRRVMSPLKFKIPSKNMREKPTNTPIIHSVC
jgi:hypothetical protein